MSSRVNNIFQVQNDILLSEILDDHKHMLTIIMYSSQTCPPCINFKPFYISMAMNNPDIFFVYIDINSFNCSKTDYLAIHKVTGTPKFVYYFNRKVIADIIGADRNIFSESTQNLNNKIKESIYLMQKERLQLENSYNNELNSKKIGMLKKLEELASVGIQLSKNYNIDSDLNGMITEYNTIISRLSNNGINGAPNPLVNTVSGPIIGQVTGPVVNSMTNPVVGPITGHVVSPVTGPVTNPINGPINGPINCPINGQVSDQQVNPPASQPLVQQVNQPVNQATQPSTQQPVMTNLQPPIQLTEQQSNVNSLLKKQEKINQINELNKLNTQIQLQEYYKLQKLHEIKKIKETDEKKV